MAQRWLVATQAAYERAEAALNKPHSANTRRSKSNSHLQANRSVRPKPPKRPSQRWPSAGGIPRRVLSSTEHKRYAGKGRPTARTPLKASEWQIQAHVHCDDAAIEQDKQAKTCYVLGTNIDASALREPRSLPPTKARRTSKGAFGSQRPAVFCLVVVCQKAQPH